MLDPEQRSLLEAIRDRNEARKELIQTIPGFEECDSPESDIDELLKLIASLEGQHE